MQDSDGNYRLVTRLNATYSESNPLFYDFVTCTESLSARKDAWERANPDAEDENKENPYEFVPTGTTVETGIATIAYLENKYTCSGICKTPLFFFSLELMKGIPKETCLSHLKSEIGDSMTYLGITSLAVGLIMMLIWVCQYSLWCKYEDEDDQIKDRNRN